MIIRPDTVPQLDQGPSTFPLFFMEWGEQMNVCVTLV